MPSIKLEQLAHIFCHVEAVFSPKLYGNQPPKSLHKFCEMNQILVRAVDMDQDGKLIKTKTGDYQIWLKKRRPAKSKDHYYFRQAFSFAHELAHWFILKHNDILSSILSGQKLNQREIETLCDQIAPVILMPSQIFTEYFTNKLTQMHPRDALMTLAHRFNTSLTAIVGRLQQLGLTIELPWIIGMFRFGYPPNPTSTKWPKWRLMPNTINLPRGIRLPTIVSHCGFSLHSPHGLQNAGLDTLRLTLPIERRTNWGNMIPDYSKSAQSSLFEDTPSVERPWEDLNPPIGPRGGTPKNTLKLPPNKLKELSKNGEIPVAKSLLSHEESPPFPLWNNKRWRLFAYELKWDVRKPQHVAPTLLITGYLGLTRRHT